MNALGYEFMATVLSMEAGSVPDNNMLIVAILFFDFLQKGFGPIQIYTGSL